MSNSKLNQEQTQLLLDFANSCAYSGGKFNLSNDILITVKAREIIEAIDQENKVELLDQDQLGMPQQCIDTGKAFVNVYGYDRAIEIIDKYISGLKEAYGVSKNSGSEPQLLMNIAVQSDFWSQTKESIKK